MQGVDETWQAHLVDMSVYSYYNKGYKFLLTIIDNFSKNAWIRPVETKSGKDVTAAMHNVLKGGRVPNKLHVDQGKQFYNSVFQALMSQYDMSMYSTFSNMKASICERFNRTKKTKMWKQFSLLGSYKWVDIIDELVIIYNNTKHSTIQMTPQDVTVRNEKHLRTLYGKLQLHRTSKIQFKVGEKVRIIKFKHIFEKSYTPNWITEIFTINQVQSTDPVTYKLFDYPEKPFNGGFYQEELTKVKYSDVYLIEKVVHKRGNQVIIKWLGFDSSHNLD